MPRPLTEISANEFSSKFGTLIGGLFVFYLLLFGNFTGDLLNCQLQSLVKENKYIRHLIGFFVLYFFVNLASANVNWNAGIKFGFSVALYILFLLSNRSEHYIVLTNIALLALVYILQMVRDTDQATIDDENSSEEDKQSALEELERVKIAQIVIACIIGVAIILGFIMYVGKRKLEYGEKFDFAKMLFDTSATCSNDVGKTYDWHQMLKAAFQTPTKQMRKDSGSPKFNDPVLARAVMSDKEIHNESQKLVRVLESDLMKIYMNAYIKSGGEPQSFITLTPEQQKFEMSQQRQQQKTENRLTSRKQSSQSSLAPLVPEGEIGSGESMRNIPSELIPLRDILERNRLPTTTFRSRKDEFWGPRPNETSV